MQWFYTSFLVIIGLFWQRKTEEFVQLIVDCERNRALLREINLIRDLDDLTIQNKQTIEKALRHLEEKLGVFISFVVSFFLVLYFRHNFTHSLPVQLSPEAHSSIHSLLNNAEGKDVHILRAELSSILVSYNIVTPDETQYLCSILLNLLEVLQTFSNRKSDISSPAKKFSSQSFTAPIVNQESSTEISKLFEKSNRFRTQASHFLNSTSKDANKEFFGSLKSVFTQERRDNLSYLSAKSNFAIKDEVEDEKLSPQCGPMVTLNEIHISFNELKSVFPAPPESQFSPVEEKKDKEKSIKESSGSNSNQRRASANNLHTALQAELESITENTRKMEEMLHPEWIGNLIRFISVLFTALLYLICIM